MDVSAVNEPQGCLGYESERMKRETVGEGSPAPPGPVVPNLRSFGSAGNGRGTSHRLGHWTHTTRLPSPRANGISGQCTLVDAVSGWLAAPSGLIRPW
jgi:hypothetical protein